MYLLLWDKGFLYLVGLCSRFEGCCEGFIYVGLEGEREVMMGAEMEVGFLGGGSLF